MEFLLWFSGYNKGSNVFLVYILVVQLYFFLFQIIFPFKVGYLLAEAARESL